MARWLLTSYTPMAEYMKFRKAGWQNLHDISHDDHNVAFVMLSSHTHAAIAVVGS